MFGLTFDRCKKLKMSSCTFLPGYLSLKNGTFGCRNPKWLDQKFENKVFWISYRNPSPRIFRFRLFIFVGEKLHEDPKKYCFWDGMNLDRWGLRGISYWKRFLENFFLSTHQNPSKSIKTHQNSSKPIRNALKPIKTHQNPSKPIKKTLFKNSRPNRFRSTPPKSFFRDKNPGRLHVTFFCFRNSQERVQHHSRK